MIPKKLFNEIRRAETVSFDIFDTLLLRPYVRPDDMFVHMERALNAPGFAEWRRTAEGDFYRAHGTGREARLDDIYSAAGKFAHMQAAEMQWEENILRANPEMKAAFDFAISQGKRVIIASDMYLPLDFIKRVLAKNGYAGYHKLYLSNEINHRKDRGDMYPYIVSDLAATPHSILHIGDNRHSDFNQARKNGINAFLYKRITDRYMAHDRRADAFYRGRPGLGASIITAMAAAHKDDADYWTDFGYKYAGPVVYAYARWIYNTARRQGLKKILFVARDGYIAEKVFKKIANDDIQTRYVYAPRMLNYTANLDYDPYLPEQPRIICQYFHQDTGGRSPAQFISEHLADFKRMAAAEKLRTGYADYIADATANAGTVVGVVDTISGQMSAQRMIEKESGVRTHGFYWLTIKGRKCLTEFAHSDFMADAMGDAFQSGNRCDLIELIFSAPENPIITMCGGRPVYQDVRNPAEAARHDIYSRIETGVLAFVDDAARLFAGNDLYLTPDDIFGLIDAYVKMPERRDMHEMNAVRKSPYADNSLYVPLFSAAAAPWRIKTIKSLVWRTPPQRAALVLANPLVLKMRGLKQVKIILLPNLDTQILDFEIFNRYGICLGSSSKRK